VQGKSKANGNEEGHADGVTILDLFVG